MKGLTFAIIAGAIGVSAWAGTAFFTNLETGWFAWVLGATIGACFVADAQTGSKQSISAFVITAVAVLGGKFLAYKATQKHILDDTRAKIEQNLYNDDLMIAYIADTIAADKRRQGKAAELAQPVNGNIWWAAENYPEQLWKRARSYWDDMTQAEQKQFRKRVEVETSQDIEKYVPPSQKISFGGSFRPLDAVFFFLAVATAYLIPRTRLLI